MLTFAKKSLESVTFHENWLSDLRIDGITQVVYENILEFGRLIQELREGFQTKPFLRKEDWPALAFPSHITKNVVFRSEVVRAAAVRLSVSI